MLGSSTHPPQVHMLLAGIHRQQGVCKGHSWPWTWPPLWQAAAGSCRLALLPLPTLTWLAIPPTTAPTLISALPSLVGASEPRNLAYMPRLGMDQAIIDVLHGASRCPGCHGCRAACFECVCLPAGLFSCCKLVFVGVLCAASSPAALPAALRCSSRKGMLELAALSKKMEGYCEGRGGGGEGQLMGSTGAVCTVQERNRSKACRRRCAPAAHSLLQTWPAR